MGNEFSMVINDTGANINIMDWRCIYDGRGKKTIELSNTIPVDPKLPFSINASDFSKDCEVLKKHVPSLDDLGKRVSHPNCKNEVELSASVLEDNIAIIFNVEKGNQLVMELVSRQEVKKSLGIKYYLYNVEQMKDHVVKKRKNAAVRPVQEATKPHGETVQDQYPKLEKKLGCWPIDGNASVPGGNCPAQPTACPQTKYILLKNEICELFKEFYRPGNDGSALNSILGNTQKMPNLNVIAEKMKQEITGQSPK